MKAIATETLDITYKDEGPADASPLLLLHKWPDDVSTWAGAGPA